MQTRAFVISLIVLATLFALGGTAFAGDTDKTPATAQTDAPRDGEDGMCPKCAAKMAEKKAAMEEHKKEMEAMEARLAGLVAAMHSAGKKDKQAAMEAVIDDLVAQHAKMNEKHAMMRGMMGGPGPMSHENCDMKGDMKTDEAATQAPAGGE